MKRKYYRIHHYNYARPMRRVKRRHVEWSSVILIALALVLAAVGVLAVLKWISLGKTSQKERAGEPASIPAVTEQAEDASGTDVP